MTKNNNIPNERIHFSEELVIRLVAFTHQTLQNDKDLLYKFDWGQNLCIISKNGSRIITYGGLCRPRFPYLISIYPLLGQQIDSNWDYELRFNKSSIMGHTQKDFFGLTYYPDKGAAYGSMPDSECDQILSEIFHTATTHKR